MGLYKNFTTVVYCIAQWAKNVTETELETQNGEAVFEVKSEPGSFAFYGFCF